MTTVLDLHTLDHLVGKCLYMCVPILFHVVYWLAKNSDRHPLPPYDLTFPTYWVLGWLIGVCL